METEEEEKAFQNVLDYVRTYLSNEVADWAVECMETLRKVKGVNSAIHFIVLLVSGDDGAESLDRCTQYLKHLLDQEIAKRG